MKCQECGLPMSICNALDSYRRAIKHFESGALFRARDYVAFANEEYDRYYKEERSGNVDD